MKKLIALTVLLSVVALGVATENYEAMALGLLAPMPFLFSPTTVLLALTAVDVTAISAFAANNQKPLISSLVNGLDIASDIMVQPNVKNKIPMPKLKVGNGIRPYLGSTEFKQSDLTYTDRYLEVKLGKRELLIDPEDYRATYLAWANTPGSSAMEKKIPFAQFMWNQVILAVQRELNDETSWKGDTAIQAKSLWAASPTTYTVGDQVKFVVNGVNEFFQCVTNAGADESPATHPAKWLNITARAVSDGIEKLVLAGISGSQISPVTTGAVSDGAGALTAAKKLFRAFTPAYKNHGIIEHVSFTDFELLLDGLSTVYRYTQKDVKPGETPPYVVLPETGGKCIVKPATWLGTSRRMVAEPIMPGDASGRGANIYLGTDLLSDMSQINTKQNLWTLEAGLKFAIGFQIQDMEAIRVGDQV